MRRLFWHWFISTIALLFAAWALAGVHIDRWYDALWIAPLLGLVNFFAGILTGIINFFALPVNLLTLGCFGFILSFIMNAVAIWLLDQPVESFSVDSFWWALALAIVMAAASSVLNMVLPGRRDRR